MKKLPLVTVGDPVQRRRVVKDGDQIEHVWVDATVNWVDPDTNIIGVTYSDHSSELVQPSDWRLWMEEE